MSMIKTVQDFLNESFGWKIDIDEKSFDKKIGRICQELGYDELSPCIKSLQNSKKNLKVLQACAREFSVGESYFFRDLDFFDYLEHHIIPSIIENSEHSFSVWSVGCSRGEELYSIAMMLQRFIPDIEKFDLYLLGTDVNPGAIDKAEKGLFTKFSFRQTPEPYMSYFKPLGEAYEINKRIKKMVHFKYYNIMDEPYRCLPPNGQKFDLILLKNVLIYFEPQKAAVAVNSLFSTLKDGGFLATTPAEYSMDIFNFPNSKCSPKGYLVQKILKKDDEVPRLFKEEVENISQNDFINDVPNIIEEVADDYLQSLPKIIPEEPIYAENSKYRYYNDALEMLKVDNKERAKEFLRQALYLDKDLVMAHILFGNILKKEKKFKTSKKHIDNAKETLSRMEPQEKVELTDGIMASDMLVMINAIKEEEV